MAGKEDIDEYDRKILIGTSTSPKTPIELSRIYGIPVAICYERVRQLEAKGYLHLVLTIVTSKGKTLRFYQNAIKEITIPKIVEVET